MRSLSELAFMPELLLWYLLVAALPMGIAGGWRLDQTTTSVLIGMAVPTAAALAMTTGNVGTLLRFRGLVIPSMVWISAIGFCVVAQWRLERHRPASGPATLAAEVQG
jgi:hypothetical protein